MNIAIVTYSLRIGGVEAVIRLLAEGFGGAGHDVAIIETLAKGEWHEAFVADGFRVEPPNRPGYRSAKYHALQLAGNLAKYDVLILNDSPLAQAGLGLLPPRTVVLVILHTCLTSMVHNATSNGENWDRIIAVSPQVAAAALAYGAPEDRVVVIPNGIDLAPELGRRPLEDSDRLEVAYIGALNHQQKGVRHLPGILRAAVESVPGIHLNVVGGGADFEWLQKEFVAQGLSQAVSMHGPLSNTAALSFLANSDVLIMPSYFEGLPMVLLEAMARGVVPVVSRLRGCTDFVIEEGEEGFLIEPGNEAGFSEKLVLLARDRNLLRRLSVASHAKATRCFSKERMVQEYILQIEKCTSEREKQGTRTGRLAPELLGDFPGLPSVLVRPTRWGLRKVGLWKPPANRQSLVQTESEGQA